MTYELFEVYVCNNYYDGRFHEWGIRPFPVLATNESEAKQVVIDNADSILEILKKKRMHNGRLLVSKKYAINICEKHLGRVKKSSRTTNSLTEFFSPQGIMKVKVIEGQIIN